MTIDELRNKCICQRCIGEAFLKAEVQRQGESRRCSYCKRRDKTYLLHELADRVEQAFDEHYARTSDQPNSWQQTLLSDKESNYEWYRDGEPVVYAIAGAADISEQAASDIQAILEDKHSDYEAAQMGDETPFASESHYEEKGVSDWEWQEEWRTFVASLETEARFFNQAATNHLSAVFASLHDLRTRDGAPIIVGAGPGTAIPSVFRARVFQADRLVEEALCQPDLHLGPPPARLATAGRMNARGISVCYGATDALTALAEVRPPVGSQVVVAQFHIRRALRLLDLTALNDVHSVGSVFDPAYAPKLEREAFLRTLCNRMARPVMPEDEPFDYLPTQAIADYLATSKELSLDGVIYPSVQLDGDGLNVALFHKAARVLKLDVPVGTEVTAHTWSNYEDGPERDYAVIEEVPPKEEPAAKADPSDHWILPIGFDATAKPDSDERERTLEIDLTSIKAHVVQSVAVTTDEHDVRRHRWEKGRNRKF